MLTGRDNIKTDLKKEYWDVKCVFVAYDED
jgi:hypothetical protein